MRKCAHEPEYIDLFFILSNRLYNPISHDLGLKQRKQERTFDSLEHACVDVGWTNGGALNSRVAQVLHLYPESFLEADSCMLGSTVVSHARCACQPSYWSDRHDVSFVPFHHSPDELLASPKMTLRINYHCFWSQTFRHFMKELSLHNSRIIYQNINISKFSNCFFRTICYLISHSYITFHR